MFLAVRSSGQRFLILLLESVRAFELQQLLPPSSFSTLSLVYFSAHGIFRISHAFSCTDHQHWFLVLVYYNSIWLIGQYFFVYMEKSRRFWPNYSPRFSGEFPYTEQIFQLMMPATWLCLSVISFLPLYLGLFLERFCRVFGVDARLLLCLNATFLSDFFRSMVGFLNSFIWFFDGTSHRVLFCHFPLFGFFPMSIDAS